MLLHVDVKGHHLLTLLNTGSTDIFLYVETMGRIGLAMMDSIDGDHLACKGVARSVPIHIVEEFSITCFVINLGCFDFILGVDYLRTLGPIV